MIKVTCAIIIKEDKLLITQNSENSDHAFQWEFPGGKVKPEESYEECIVREIHEELNIQIEVLEALVPVEHDYGTKQICLIPFLSRTINGSIVLNDHIAAKWVRINELQKIDFSEADRILIELKENRNILEKHIGKQVNKS